MQIRKKSPHFLSSEQFSVFSFFTKTRKTLELLNPKKVIVFVMVKVEILFLR